MARSSDKSQDQLAVLHPLPKLFGETPRTRPEKLDSIIGNLEGYRAETKKEIIAQAIIEKYSAGFHQPGNSTDPPPGHGNHIRVSNIVAAQLRTRWEPGSDKPTFTLSTRESTLLPGLPPPVPKILAEKTVARLDYHDKQSGGALDKFYKSKERSRRDSAHGSVGSGGATSVVENRDPRLAGRPANYDASRDPRLRR